MSESLFQQSSHSKVGEILLVHLKVATLLLCFFALFRLFFFGRLVSFLVIKPATASTATASSLTSSATWSVLVIIVTCAFSISNDLFCLSSKLFFRNFIIFFKLILSFGFIFSLDLLQFLNLFLEDFGSCWGAYLNRSKFMNCFKFNRESLALSFRFTCLFLSLLLSSRLFLRRCNFQSFFFVSLLLCLCDLELSIIDLLFQCLASIGLLNEHLGFLVFVVGFNMNLTESDSHLVQVVDEVIACSNVVEVWVLAIFILGLELIHN